MTTRTIASLVSLGCVHLLATSSCDPEAAKHEKPIEESSSQLNGTIKWGEWEGTKCNGDKAGIQAAFTAAMNNVLVPGILNNPNDVQECLKDAILSGEEIGADGFRYAVTYPELIIRRLRENVPTRISCKDTLPGGQGCGWGDHPETPESFACLPEKAGQTSAALGGDMIHEIAHRFYTHPMPDLTFDYNAVVNEQLRQCLSTRFATGVATPFHQRRSGLTSEATLSQVGTEGTQPTRPESCAQHEFLRGLHGRAGAKIDRLGGVCSSAGGSPTDLPATGGSGGSPFSSHCAQGSFVVGIAGRASNNIDAIGVLCQPDAQVRAGSSQGVTALPFNGGTGGDALIRRCPPFMAIKSLRLKAGALVDRVEVHCQDVREPRRVQHTATIDAGNFPGDNKHLELCANRGVMHRFYSQSNAGTDVVRLGAICSKVDFVGGSFPSEVTFSGTAQPVYLPSHGGVGGTVALDDCAADQAMVGLETRVSNSTVVGVAAICANLRTWSRGGNTTTTKGPTRGSTGSLTVTQLCGAGQVMNGWYIGSQTRVRGITPVCRNFGS